jgi:hypothetical protein
MRVLCIILQNNGLSVNVSNNAVGNSRYSDEGDRLAEAPIQQATTSSTNRNWLSPEIAQKIMVLVYLFSLGNRLLFITKCSIYLIWSVLSSRVSKAAGSVPRAQSQVSARRNVITNHYCLLLTRGFPMLCWAESYGCHWSRDGYGSGWSINTSCKWLSYEMKINPHNVFPLYSTVFEWKIIDRKKHAHSWPVWRIERVTRGWHFSMAYVRKRFSHTGVIKMSSWILKRPSKIFVFGES